MTRPEFASVMAFLGAGVGKQVPADQAEAYYDLLNDVPLDSLKWAARQALLQAKFPVIPTAGSLRELANEHTRSAAIVPAMMRRRQQFEDAGR